jgi:hypothetical protein
VVADDDGDAHCDADAETFAVLGRGVSGATRGESGVQGAGRALWSSAEGKGEAAQSGAAQSGAASGLQQPCELTAANVAKLQTDLDASLEEDGGAKKRARVLAWKVGADQANLEQVTAP